MTEFENNEPGEVPGESPINPGQNPQSYREQISNITNQPDFRWSQTRLFKWGSLALAAAAIITYDHFANGSEQTPLSAGAGPEVACASPTPKALAATTALFNAEPYRLSAAPAAKDHARVIVNPSADFISLPDNTVATHYGLKVPYYNPQLFPAYNSPDMVNTKSEISLAEQYLGKFGIKVQIDAHPDVVDGVRITNLTQSELQQNEVRTLGVITWDIQESPIEYVHLSGLKKIIFTGGIGGNNETEWADPNTLLWDITSQPREGDMNYALYQGIDSRECGFGSDGDPKYAALNGRNIYGPPKTHKGLLSEDHLVLQQPTKEERKLGNAVRAAYNDIKFGANDSIIYKDPRRACRLDEDFNIGEVSRVAVEHHADFSSAMQDKYDLGADFNWSANGYSEFLDPNAPILRRKALFLLARLYELDPSIVEYFAGFSGRPGTLGGVVDCTKYGFSQPKGEVQVFP